MNRTHRLYGRGPMILFALLAGSCAMPSLAGAPAIAQPDIAVQCAGGRGFLMRVAAEEAVVRVYGRDLRLPRKPSSALRHYSSADAALVIDGEFVAFVMTDALNFNGCHLMPNGKAAAIP